MINSSITMKTFVMKWKIGKVIPILKGKEHSQMEPGSFRPVSLLPVISKLVECTVQVQLQKHLEKYRLLYPNSHAYRASRSTTTAIMQVLDTLYQATDNNQMTSLMALDQSAAFDSVNHSLLLRKLKLYKCSNSTMEWMQSYLESRSQYISIGGQKSRMSALYRGVPQGSILGPLLYLVYINEIAETISDSTCRNPIHDDRSKLFTDNCENCGIIVTYADDATFLISDRSRTQNQLKLNLNLAKIEQFLNENELAINV